MGISNLQVLVAMQFPFDLSAVVGAPPEHEGPCVGFIDERVLRGDGFRLRVVLEELGRLSALAQGLRRWGRNASSSRRQLLACPNLLMYTTLFERWNHFAFLTSTSTKDVNAQDMDIVSSRPCCIVKVPLHPCLLTTAPLRSCLVF